MRIELYDTNEYLVIFFVNKGNKKNRDILFNQNDIHEDLFKDGEAWIGQIFMIPRINIFPNFGRNIEIYIDKF